MAKPAYQKNELSGGLLRLMMICPQHVARIRERSRIISILQRYQLSCSVHRASTSSSSDSESIPRTPMFEEFVENSSRRGRPSSSSHGSSSPIRGENLVFWDQFSLTPSFTTDGSHDISCIFLSFHYNIIFRWWWWRLGGDDAGG